MASKGTLETLKSKLEEEKKKKPSQTTDSAEQTKKNPSHTTGSTEQTTTSVANNDKLIESMYKNSLASTKDQLQQDYMKADANYLAQKEAAQKATDANLNRTAVEAQKAAMSREELNNAYGLSSGARAQSRLVSDMQTQSDMAALRAQQQNVDAEVERQRGLLAQEYSAAIRKAQSDNDLQLAQALYDEAQRKEQLLLAQQEADAAALQESYKQKLDAAKFYAEETGDYTAYGKMLGLSKDQIAKLNGGTGNGDSTNVGKVKNSIVDADTFAEWGAIHFNGRDYNDYKKYVQAVIIANEDKLTDQEITELLQYYGVV